MDNGTQWKTKNNYGHSGIYNIYNQLQSELEYTL